MRHTAGAGLAGLLLLGLSGQSGLARAEVPAATPAATPAAAPAPAARAEKVVVERIAAVVGDAIVLESEVAQRAAPVLAELEPEERRRRVRAVLKQALDELVDEELIAQAAVESELEVNAEEVDRAIDDVKKSNKLTDSQFEGALAAQGYTMSAYRREIRRNLLRLRAVNVVVRPRVSVTDDDVRAYYDRTAARSAGPSELRVAHLLVRLDEGAAPEARDTARRRAGELLARVRGGADFAELARAESDDPASREAGGDLGWFKRGELPTEWEETLFAMEAGESRGPIAGPQGLHLFRVVEVKREASRPFEEQKPRLRQQLFAERMEKATRQWIDELRRKGHVELKLQPPP